ncbi:MAG: thermonuclease family protein [Alphaproteobacteria bacterium]|nr:thermonuclease family protein [Alphaproteobacteria bacterium]
MIAPLRLLQALFVIITVTLAAPDSASARDGLPHDFAGLAAGDNAIVREIVDGDTVILDDGRQVRLVGIQAPKLPLGRTNFEKWPLADEAKNALAKLVLGRRVTLGYGGQRQDRYGRELAHLFTDDGLWVQGSLLELGFARVYSFADNRSLVDRMLEAERAARTGTQGIWQHPYYTILDTEAAADQTGRYSLVEGRVLETAIVRGRAYLNFDEDYRTDFTISISSQNLKSFEKSGIIPQDYAGRRVRVRGWLRWSNGPMIEVTHPEQIEVLTP